MDEERLSELVRGMISDILDADVRVSLDQRQNRLSIQVSLPSGFNTRVSSSIEIDLHLIMASNAGPIDQLNTHVRRYIQNTRRQMGEQLVQAAEERRRDRLARDVQGLGPVASFEGIYEGRTVPSTYASPNVWPEPNPRFVDIARISRELESARIMGTPLPLPNYVPPPEPEPIHFGPHRNRAFYIKEDPFA